MTSPSQTDMLPDAPIGTLPTGTLPTGMLPTGMLPTGMLPTGMLPTGMLPTGMLPGRGVLHGLVGCLVGGAALVVALASFGCTGQLDPPTLVKTPRILSIIADQPESVPGNDIEMGVIAFVPSAPDGTGISYHWRVCDSLPRVLEAAQIPADLPLPDTCRPLESTGPTAIVPGERTAALAALITSLPSSGSFDASFLTRILETAGIPFQVEVDVVDASGTVLVTGIKTLAITTRAEPLPPPTTNPPPVMFSLGDGMDTTHDVDVAFPEDLFDFRCVPTMGEVSLPARMEAVITPVPGTEWTEEFPIFDYSGEIRIGRENEYYSFYATGGSIDTETTNPPNRETHWTTPEDPGTVRLWVIVRDGHLGARGCWLDVTITAPSS
ncbi:MAG: hypothetical protein K1X94_00050 [Sandaracinaceae bacterium]|nr:hypothetical protein [Sandaracinaceae bacterium]